MLHLSQSDKRWSLVKIGKTLLTLGRWGCTITCIAMLSSFFGFYLSPIEIAKFSGLFNADGKIIWSMIEKLFKGKFKFVWRYYKRNDKAIRESIAGATTCVILEVRNGSHWVVATGVYGNDYYCIDPVDGKKKLVIANFGNITGSAHLIKT